MQESDKQILEKKLAAEKATEFVKNNMIIGLGTGSTVYYAINKLGELVKNGLNIKAVSTSDATTKLANSFNIPLISINDVDEIDLTIDGADEVDKNFNGIKGGGGALLYEKIVALLSKKNIWAVDSSKLVDKLGKFPLPVEVVPFGYKRIFTQLNQMNYNPVIRKKENEFYLTDSGNYIFDLHVKKITDTWKLDEELKLITGIVETGLFINVVDIVIIGKNNSTDIIERKK